MHMYFSFYFLCECGSLSVCAVVSVHLFHSKTASLLHSLGQLIAEQLIALVGRQVDAIKAGVCLGQILRGNIRCQVNGKESWSNCPRRALQRSESLQRHARRACHKL